MMFAPLLALVLAVTQAQQPDPAVFMMWTAEATLV